MFTTKTLTPVLIVATVISITACSTVNAAAPTDMAVQLNEGNVQALVAEVNGNPQDVQVANAGASTDAAASSNAAVVQNVNWGNNVNITVADDTFTFQSDGIPNHDYLPAYAGFNANGSVDQAVRAQNYNMELPLNPEFADAPTQTNLGAIGVAISGAVFFNPFEGDGVRYAADDANLVVNGLPFIDGCGGHPVPTNGAYHYHGTPYCITDVVDTPGQHSVIIGYLFDGFAVYGPQDVDGSEPTDLDECSGHFGPTPEYPEGIYHYHTTSTAPYMPTCYSGVVSINVGPGGMGGNAPAGGQGGPQPGGPPTGGPAGGKGGNRP